MNVPFISPQDEQARYAASLCVNDLVPIRTHLRLLSYNIQAGIASTRAHHYVTQGWKNVLPHTRSFENLDRIAHVVSDYDVVALQEADAGSMRSYFINQVEYLARRGHFPFWYHQTNRNLGKFAQHSNGLLSKIEPQEIVEHKLPGLIPGRGLMMARYGGGSCASRAVHGCTSVGGKQDAVSDRSPHLGILPGAGEHPLVILLAHLALSKRARMQQLAFISEIVNNYQHVVLMGDLNCQPQSKEMDFLIESTHLCEPLETLHTFPSWRPFRNIDHILVTPSLKISNVQVLSHAISDHLPISLELALPASVRLPV